MNDDYLEKSGVKDLLSQAIGLVLARKPLMPITFLAEHFQSNDEVDPIVRTFRLLRTQFQKQTNREEIILEAFHQLTTNTTTSTTNTIQKQINEMSIQRTDYIQLIQLMTQDFPIQIKDKILHQILKLEGSPVRYKEFQRVINICLLFDELFDVVEELFVSIDSKSNGQGQIESNVLFTCFEQSIQKNTNHHHNQETTSILILLNQLLTTEEDNKKKKWTTLDDLFNLFYRVIFTNLV